MRTLPVAKRAMRTRSPATSSVRAASGSASSRRSSAASTASTSVTNDNVVHIQINLDIDIEARLFDCELTFKEPSPMMKSIENS